MNIIFDGSIQLGDTPSPMHFPTAQFVGLQLHLPIRPFRIPTNDGDVLLNFETSQIETWADWQKHEILISGESIGHIGDPNDASGPTEDHELTIPKTHFDKIDQGFHVLSIIVGADHPSLIDDFELRRISVVGAKIILGW